MYMRMEILKRCDAALADVRTFYKQDFINYGGRTNDTNELFTEVVAEFVISHIDKFEMIPQITRLNSYKTNSHDGVFDKKSNRQEEIIAMKMFVQSKEKPFALIGSIIDYQTPLKNKRNDEAGKIDLLADDGQQLIILELKKPDSTETMLRCVMEGFTYYKTVDKGKLLKDFGRPETYGLSAAPFVFKDSRQYMEMREERPQLKRLMALLMSKPYYITEDYGKYFVTED